MSLTLVDASLRDGMHSVAHQFTTEQIARVAGGLDRAGVDVIEVSHGDGLGGSSIQYGEALCADEALVAAAAGALSGSRLAVLLLPGIGTLAQLVAARDLGASVARVATHCTEADIAEQHLGWARENGMVAVGFLMMSHMLDPAALTAQARLMESYGAQVVYVVDSAGALVPATVTERIAALRDALEGEIGFHAHDNLGCAIGNSLAAVEAGATWIDGSLRGLGAGAGNARTEVLAAALERSGRPLGADLFALMDLAQDEVAPLMPREQIIDRGALMLGYAGVYSSFLLHAERAAAKYRVDAREILMELGRRRVVGGQEDMIIDVAAQLAGMGAGGGVVSPEALAERLERAERERTAIPQLSSSEPGLDVAAAYEVQAIGHRRRLAEGERALGFKLGLTSRAKQLAMGVAEPLWGRLTSGMLHDEGEPLDVGGLIHPRVEPEIAFLLGRDVDGATANVASVLAATEGLFPALEILDSRYEHFAFTLPDVIADNASAAKLVLGGRLLDPAALDMQLEGMVLRRNGEVVDTAAGAAIAGHPAAAVAWLARAAGGLPAGAIVLSGGLTAPVPLAPGGVVSAEYTTLGSVTLRCA